MISPIYQEILTCDNNNVTVGDPSNPQFEPALAWLNQLGKVYEKTEEPRFLDKYDI